MNSRLVAKLTAPLAVVCALLVSIAIGAAWYVRDLQKTVSHLLSINVVSVIAAQELEISIREVRTHFDRYLRTGEQKYLEPVPRIKQRTAAALEEAENAATTPKEQALTKRIRQGYEHFFAEYEKVLKAPPPQGFHPKLMELIDTVLSDEILEPAHEYLRMNEAVLTKSTQENSQITERLTLGMVSLGVCVAFGGLIGGWLIAVNVRRSIQRTEDQLRTTAKQLNRAVPADKSLARFNGQPIDALQQVAVSVSAVLKRLERTERDALRAEQLAWVGQMAAGIAHEIRNPLMAIKLLIQAAADRRGGPALKPRDFQVLEEEIVRLEQIVSGFLDFARPPRPEKRPVNLLSLLNQTTNGIRARADLQGVTIPEISAAPAVVVNADPNQLRQVFYNLLFNALDSQPQGGQVEVTVAVPEPLNTSVAGVEITVRDRGPGLPVDLGDRIFEPFVSTKESGMGLGLSICRRIVDSHGGSLTATNRPDGGAVFSIRLPLPQPDRSNDASTIAIRGA